jgi:molybdate transport system substrate-binding protein
MRVQAVITIVVLLLAAAVKAQTIDIRHGTPALRVLGSNGMKAVIDELRPRLEKEVGRPLTITFDTSTAVRQHIEAGDAFDVAVLTAEVIDDLAKSGKIDRRSVVELGRAGIGFGVRDGGPKPDVKTPEAVKQTMLNAKSLTWVTAGASREHIDKMIEALGIASAIKSKVALTKGVDESNDLVAQGKNEMVVTLISEIKPAKGVQYVGPLPDQFQSYVKFAAGASPKSALPAASALFIKQLTVPPADKVYVAKGMEGPAGIGLRDKKSVPK